MSTPGVFAVVLFRCCSPQSRQLGQASSRKREQEYETKKWLASSFTPSPIISYPALRGGPPDCCCRISTMSATGALTRPARAAGRGPPARGSDGLAAAAAAPGAP